MMKNLIFCLSIFLIFISCSKDDVAQDGIVAGKNIIETPQGSYFILKGPNGSRDTLIDNYVTLGSGQLLDQAFYRVFNVSTPKGSFNFRVSFPNTMIGKAEEALYAKHKLNTERLPLEETKYMKSIYPELDFSSSRFFSTKNASGSVDLKNNYNYEKKTYSIFGEVYIRVEGRDNNLYDLEGIFWKE